jgi:anaerobic glycerol-3-phosphate dehydrogenase
LTPARRKVWASFVQFAKDFCSKDFQNKCLEAVASSVSATGKNFKHLFFPPALGLEAPTGFLNQIEQQNGCTASEVLGASHSVPGLRISAVLQRGCQKDEVVG